MMPNIKMKELLEIKEFQEIVNKYGLSTLWCMDTVFLFNKKSAILFQDLVQEDETDVFLYNRDRQACTANMYGIAEYITNIDDEKLIELENFYLENIDFGRIGLHSDRKKISLSFSLALLKLYGDKILCDSWSEDFYKIFTKPILSVTLEWENCMEKHT